MRWTEALSKADRHPLGGILDAVAREGGPEGVYLSRTDGNFSHSCLFVISRKYEQFTSRGGGFPWQNRTCGWSRQLK
jgi:hypothetical protein